MILARIDPFNDDPTGVMCLYCFAEIQSRSRPEGTLLFCDCYARFFEPGNDRHKGLTQTRWQSYIDTSEGWKLNQKIATTPIVNRASLGCWCPACRRDRQIASIGVWLSTSENFVATYGTCKACTRRYAAASNKGKTEILNRCEESLLQRYSFLKDHL